MANISQGSTENVVLGEGYSPWALNSNDLYPDSTSYIVGIGTTDPGCPLHINKNTLPASFTADSDAAIILSDDDNNNVIESISTTSRERLKLQTKQDSTINCRLDLGAGGTDIGFYPGGSNQARIGSTGMALGLGGDATPDGARLHIKDASSPQLKLDDGTNYATWQMAGDDLILNVDGGALDNLTIEADTGKFIFQSNAGSNNTVTLNADNGWNYIPSIANTTLNTKIIKSGAAISAPTGIFFDWGRKEANTSKTADYTAGQGDHVVFCDPTSGSMTITLPEATGGRVMRIKNTTTGLANTVTVATPASETIDGQASSVLSASYGTIELVADGTNWFILNVV